MATKTFFTARRFHPDEDRAPMTFVATPLTVRSNGGGGLRRPDDDEDATTWWWHQQQTPTAPEGTEGVGTGDHVEVQCNAK